MKAAGSRGGLHRRRNRHPGRGPMVMPYWEPPHGRPASQVPGGCAGCRLALRPAERVEYGDGVEVVPPVHDFPVAEGEDGDELVVVRVPGGDGVPVRGVFEYRDHWSSGHGQRLKILATVIPPGTGAIPLRAARGTAGTGRPGNRAAPIAASSRRRSASARRGRQPIRQRRGAGSSRPREPHAGQPGAGPMHARPRPPGQVRGRLPCRRSRHSPAADAHQRRVMARVRPCRAKRAGRQVPGGGLRRRAAPRSVPGPCPGRGQDGLACHPGPAPSSAGWVIW